MKNHMKLEFLSVSENEPFARNTIAAFCLSLNPTLDELSDVKTAVSEAVTNTAIASVLFIIAWDAIELQ